MPETFTGVASGHEWHPSLWFQTEWSTMMKAAYENMGYTMKPFVLPPAKINGKKMVYPVRGFGKASKRGHRSKIKPMNVSGGKVEMEASTFDAADYEYVDDRADLGNLAPAAKQVIFDSQAGALGRVHDIEIFAAIHKYSGKYGPVIGSFDEPWDLNKNMQIRRRFVQNNVKMDGNINSFMPSTPFLQCMGYDQFTKDNYQGPQYPLVGSTAPQTFLNVNWHEQPDDVFQEFAVENKRDKADKTGLKSGYTFYAFHKFAVGSGEQFTKQTDFAYEHEWPRWWYNDYISVGATVIHDWEKDLGMKYGIVECRCDNLSDVEFRTSVNSVELAQILGK